MSLSNKNFCFHDFFFFFSVVANDEQAPSIADEDVGGMPDWAIAVVVIGLGSFAFVIVFGITVVNIECIFLKKSHTCVRLNIAMNLNNHVSLL